VEIEHVDTAALASAAAAAGVPAHPSPATVALIQDKYLQKAQMAEAGVPVGPFEAVSGIDSIKAAATVRGSVDFFRVTS
jgi:phosphoribosylaminoimidazole carboxylase (NCAIR synthetase)